jgi:CheY-like chemotaxis protein
MDQGDDEASLWPIYILVVEDEPALRSLLSDELQDAGFTVIEASNADEAWRYCVLDTDLDLVFTDIEMPGSMNGLALARRLQKVNPFLPLIITSGNLGDQSIDDLGPFLPKPYRLDEAVKLVFHILGVSRPARFGFNSMNRKND